MWQDACFAKDHRVPLSRIGAQSNLRETRATAQVHKVSSGLRNADLELTSLTATRCSFRLQTDRKRDKRDRL